MPLVSIIVPAYNHKIYILDLFQSLINQTYKVCELIFVDDCSNDGTYEAIVDFKRKYEKLFKLVLAIRQEKNVGISKNINCALKYTNGAYIKIIASDDILLDDAIERYVKFMEKNNKCSYVLGNAYIVENNYKYGDNLTTKLAYKKSLRINAFFFYKLAMGNFICAPGVFFRKSTFEKYGNFDERFRIEDYPYWIKSFDENVMIDTNPYVCYRYTYKPFSYRKKNSIDYSYYEYIYENSIKKIEDKRLQKKISTVFLAKLQLEYGLNNKLVNSKIKSVILKYKINVINILVEMIKHKLRITKKHFLEFLHTI